MIRISFQHEPRFTLWKIAAGVKKIKKIPQPAAGRRQEKIKKNEGLFNLTVVDEIIHRGCTSQGLP